MNPHFSPPVWRALRFARHRCHWRFHDFAWYTELQEQAREQLQRMSEARLSHHSGLEFVFSSGAVAAAGSAALSR